MKISLSKQAAKYYEKAPANIQDKFEKAFQSILEGEGDIKAMRGEPGFFRFRAGSFRIIFSVKADIVVIEKIGPRGDVYKK
ncbi:MAG TPA: type II toxin-antitoxin system RelE/ParE family toxin [Anaerolineaceae bacterium]|nr:type II toxin-antitoxin system RelE/ParE family toxin [Anaerolineaceae bacterium]